MNAVTISYMIRDQKTGAISDRGDFTSEHPYYEMGKILSNIDPSTGSKVVDFEDENGKDAKYTVVKKNPKFIKSEYNHLPQAYLDAMDEPLPRYLTCVDPEKNSYKFYQIEIKNNRTHVQYGRIGDDHGQFGLREYEYDLDMYWVKYFEKISKGYIDQSEIKDFDKKEKKDVLPDKTVKMAKIKSPMVQDIVDYLIRNARDYVQKNYNYVSGKENTGFNMTAIEKVNGLLDDMQKMIGNNGSISDVERYKQKFYAVISVLPRYISDVGQYTAQALNRPQATLDHERDLVEALRVVLENDELTRKNKDKKATVLDKTGLKIKPVTFNEKLDIQKRMGSKISCISRLLKVENTKTESAYKDWVEKNGIREEGRKLFFHGSRTENWWSIMTKGMSLNPNAVITGKMFGQGLYFAPKAEKSMGYTDQSGSFWAHGTSNKGYLALYEVAMGKEYHPHHILGSSFRGSDLKHGCHSVYAKGGTVGLRNDEAIIYNEKQCTIRYLIETGRDRNLSYRMNLQNLTPRSFTMGEPFENEKGVNVPIVMMSKSGREEWAKIGMGIKKPVLVLDSKDAYFYDAAKTNDARTYTIPDGDMEFFKDRAMDKICQTCKLERSEEGFERFYKEKDVKFSLPKAPDQPIVIIEPEKDRMEKAPVPEKEIEDLER